MNPSDHLNDLAEQVIGGAYEVANVLGPGFLEKVYERALLRQLTLRNVSARTQVPFAVWYKEQCVGEYLADLVIDDQLIVAQAINYLKASGNHLALLFNFQ